MNGEEFLAACSELADAVHGFIDAKGRANRDSVRFTARMDEQFSRLVKALDRYEQTDRVPAEAIEEF